jgi:hypothetical protein
MRASSFLCRNEEGVSVRPERRRIGPLRRQRNSCALSSANAVRMVNAAPGSRRFGDVLWVLSGPSVPPLWAPRAVSPGPRLSSRCVGAVRRRGAPAAGHAQLGATCGRFLWQDFLRKRPTSNIACRGRLVAWLAQGKSGAARSSICCSQSHVQNSSVARRASSARESAKCQSGPSRVHLKGATSAPPRTNCS